MSTVPAFPAPPRDAGVFQPFWDAAARGELAMPICQSCGRAVWYPAPRCPECGGDRITWTLLSGEGTLFTFTLVHRSFLSGVSVDAPFAVGLVELDGARGSRLVSDVDADPGRLAIGMRLRARFEEIGGVRRPVFVPAEEARSQAG